MIGTTQQKKSVIGERHFQEKYGARSTTAKGKRQVARKADGPRSCISKMAKP